MSQPIDREFCYRVAQLQLVTNSHDQGWATDSKLGSFSWFELVIFEDEHATEPRTDQTGAPLRWNSHSNALALQEPSMHYGVVFDRRGNLLDSLEPGNCIGVYCYARFQGWENQATEGRLHVKVLNEDLFCRQSWTLASVKRPDLADEQVANGIYTIMAPSECHVEATGNELASKIWFTSPILDADTIAGVEEVRLFTLAHRQREKSDTTPTPGSRICFDIVILGSPEDTVPKVMKGISMVWSSHDVLDQYDGMGEGEIFNREHAMLGALEVGDVLAVRAAAQGKGWANHATEGRLVIRISNRETKELPELPNLENVSDILQKFEKVRFELRQELATEGVAPPPYTPAAIVPELRADDALSAPLRLLSLDGGGVRGISSLRILYAILKKVTGKNDEQMKAVKPYEYFDMIAGTSTGGLIAIMLGRMQMTIGECETQYTNMSKSIFGANKLPIWNEATAFSAGTTMYEGDNLKNAVRALLKTRKLDEDATMVPDKADGGCKVFAVATDAKHINTASSAIRLRTYVNPKRPEPKDFAKLRIWEAARATSAALVYFTPIQIGSIECVDGGMVYNNPTAELVSEAFSVFGSARPIGCLLTIGTGVPTEAKALGTPSLKTSVDWMKSLVTLATNSEKTHASVKELADGFPKSGDDAKYWRMNLDLLTPAQADLREHSPNQKAPSIADSIITLDDYKRMADLAKWTDKWLEGQTALVEQCAARLSEAGKIAEAMKAAGKN